jgi:hypothetical protein
MEKKQLKNNYGETMVHAMMIHQCNTKETMTKLKIQMKPSELDNAHRLRLISTNWQKIHQGSSHMQ